MKKFAMDYRELEELKELTQELDKYMIKQDYRDKNNENWFIFGMKGTAEVIAIQEPLELLNWR